MTHPQFIKNIDWKFLREQKKVLWNLTYINAPLPLYDFEGLIHLIDAIQDYSVDIMGLSEEEVFNLNPEEE